VAPGRRARCLRAQRQPVLATRTSPNPSDDLAAMSIRGAAARAMRTRRDTTCVDGATGCKRDQRLCIRRFATPMRRARVPGHLTRADGGVVQNFWICGRPKGTACSSTKCVYPRATPEREPGGMGRVDPIPPRWRAACGFLMREVPSRNKIDGEEAPASRHDAGD